MAYATAVDNSHNTNVNYPWLTLKELVQETCPDFLRRILMHVWTCALFSVQEKSCTKKHVSCQACKFLVHINLPNFPLQVALPWVGVKVKRIILLDLWIQILHLVENQYQTISGYLLLFLQAATAQGQPSDHGTQPPNKRPKMALPSTATSAVPVVDYQVWACAQKTSVTCCSQLNAQLSKL